MTPQRGWRWRQLLAAVRPELADRLFRHQAWLFTDDDSCNRGRPARKPGRRRAAMLTNKKAP
jgi:hypothetical protein